MAYTFEFGPAEDGPFVDADGSDHHVRAWSIDADGAVAETLTDYTPAFHVAAGGPPADHDLSDAGRERLLATAREHLAGHPDVVGTALQRRRRGLEHDAEPVLRVDVTRVDAVRGVAQAVRSWASAGTYRCFGVDHSPGFRVCLATDRDPTPPCPRAQAGLVEEPSTGADAGGTDADPTAIDTTDADTDPAVVRPLRVCRLSVSPGVEAPVAAVEVDGDSVSGEPRDVVETVHHRLAERDPDVLRVHRAGVVPALFETAAAVGVEQFRLGRRPGYRTRASASTYESYGRVGHSPARYGVPGRAVVDESNTFFLRETNLAGALDLVRRSRKPLQELSWASIGTVLTAIQVREARRRNVLAPWRAWRHERFKSMGTLHDADRGGTTLAPEVGVHEDVHEVDFASLYPNVIVTRNLSPETVRCPCHDRADVPELGYSVCDDPGFLPDVLEPLVAARERVKAALEDAEGERRRVLEGRSSALKWILVSCFGYQGFSNATYGRIECHEAINAHAREILLDAKDVLERNGWRVLHGIVDSLWVTPAAGNRVPLPTLCERITERGGIRMEYEGAFDWVAFCPTRDGEAGALTRYFGRRADAEPAPSRADDDPDALADPDEAYKLRGVECRRDDCPPFVADVQRALVRAFDRERDPAAVIERLRTAVARLERGDVAPGDLATEVRVSRRAGQYEQSTRTVAALERARRAGRERAPGQRVRYVVVDDERRSSERVRLAEESLAPERVDTAHYRDRLVRAATSVLSPLGWSAGHVRGALAGHADAPLSAF